MNALPTILTGVDDKLDNSTGQNGGKRILIVDDETDIIAVLKRGLEREGFQVDVYNDPHDALDSFKAPGKYDLALLDINMPDMNGFQLFRELRSRDEKLRVCFITAFEIYYDEFRRVFPKIKVSCFVRKPVTISSLAETIRREIESPLAKDQEYAEARVKKEASDPRQLALTPAGRMRIDSP